MATRSTYRRSRSAVERKAAAEARREKVAALQEQLAGAVEDLTRSDAWMAMLAAAARFHSYSVNNLLLIGMQAPTATRVAGFTTWKKLGRTVRKGEKGIAILAPCTYKTQPAEQVEDTAAVDAGERDQATEPTATAAGGRRQLRGFKVVYVFDIAQTDGEPLPDAAPQLLAGQAPAGLWESLAAHVAELGYTLRREDCAPANGRTHRTRRVVEIRPDLDDAQAVKTLAHELAHIVLGHTAPDYPYVQQREVSEVAAESVAFVLCQAAGMDTTGYSAPYLAHWADGDTATVTATAAAVVATASALIARHLEDEPVVDEPAA